LKSGPPQRGYAGLGATASPPHHTTACDLTEVDPENGYDICVTPQQMNTNGNLVRLSDRNAHSIRKWEEIGKKIIGKWVIA